MNFFKLYIGDYQRDTAHLSITEHGAYLLMLQHYYATEKPLPTGKTLHRMLRVQDKCERDAVDAVAAQFWHETPDGLVNGRADNEITKADAQADTNGRIAREREAKRKASRQTHEVEHDSCTIRPTIDQPIQTPDTRHQTNTTPKPPSALPDGFVEFWDRYRKKIGKPAAIKAFRAAKLNGHLPEVLADIDARLHSDDWLKEGGKFIPYPATYLNQRRWEDDHSLSTESSAWEGAK